MLLVIKLDGWTPRLLVYVRGEIVAAIGSGMITWHELRAANWSGRNPFSGP
jgi:hypothetical protein